MKTITTSQKLICGIALLGTTLLISCGTNRKVKVAELPKAKTIEILAVNDMHAAIDNFPRLALWLTVCGIYTPTYCLFRVVIIKQETRQTTNIPKREYPSLS